MKHVFVFSLVILVMGACSKYEDGPSFSLKSKKSRLSGEWVVDSYTYNGVEMKDTLLNQLGANYVLEIEKDGVYRTEGAYPDQGTWELGEDGDDVRFLSNASGSVEISYRILRLASKELWMRHTATNGDVTVTKYTAKD